MMDERDWLTIATFLFDLLDDTDTASDVAKGDDKLYRQMVEKIHHKRFWVAETDGYNLTFKRLGE